MATRTGDFSPYHYSANNPVNINDPTGLFYNKPAPNVNSSGGSAGPLSNWGEDEPGLNEVHPETLEDDLRRVRDGEMTMEAVYKKHGITPATATSAITDPAPAVQPTVTQPVEQPVTSTEDPASGPDRAKDEYGGSADPPPSSAQDEEDKKTGDPGLEARKRFADFLRYSPVIPGPYYGLPMINPFFGAEAIYLDGGWSLAGQEGDKGVFFVLTGVDQGKAFSFTEKTEAALGIDAGLGIEIGRVDTTGDPSQFKSADLYGYRDKVYAGTELASFGASFSRDSFGNSVISSSVQLGLSLSPFPFVAGYNNGLISKP